MKKRMQTLLFFLVIALFPHHVRADFRPATPIKIFVTVQPQTPNVHLTSETSSYIDPNLSESLAHLQNSIRSKKDWWTLVDKPEDAQTLLTLQTRIFTANVDRGAKYSSNETNTRHDGKSMVKNTRSRNSIGPLPKSRTARAFSALP